MLVLASQSPRRAELLRNAGIAFEVLPAHVPEEAMSGEPPRDYVVRLARAKALAVLAQRPDALVLGADTTVVVDEHILEKPRDPDDAARMLRLLSGRAHQVMTGVCLAWVHRDTARSNARVEVTEVRFTRLADDAIAEYVRSGEPMDKAGAYAIQGMASRWVERISGCYFNVVGLPVPLVWRMLREREA